MPTYEYHCEKCDHTFEVFQSMSDEPLEYCPEDQCKLSKWGRGKVKRLIGPGAGLIFKGSGFYITDYRSESYKKDAKKAEQAHSASSSEKTSTQSSNSDKAGAKSEKSGKKKAAE
ncbi:MAG: zinc ribbon domain-containing protein [Verrucomicrobia bacterium]|nr:zinc ribbon domain-containing protein [Verrucomicrobiota bacterium]